MSVEEIILNSYLQQLRLTTFVQNQASFATEAVEKNHSYTRFLMALAAQEVEHRQAQRRERRLKAAKFPIMKSLHDFNFEVIPSLKKQHILQLAQGDYIAQCQPLILLGNPGLGKTHIAISLAAAACRQNHRVRFYHAATLVNELMEAQQQGLLNKFLETALRHQLFVIDELGFIPFTQKGAHLIFQFFSTLYERVALIITTNLHFAAWTQVFGDEQLTVALLDRLTHRAHILEFVGESYRFRERLEQQAEQL